VTIHDNNVDGFAVFNANQLAKHKGATPFKRPENGVFRPGTHFREFFFTERVTRTRRRRACRITADSAASCN